MLKQNGEGRIAKGDKRQGKQEVEKQQTSTKQDFNKLDKEQDKKINKPDTLEESDRLSHKKNRGLNK
jgi:hypothetical protein